LALAPLLTWGYHDPANQRADILPGFAIGLRLGQRFRKTGYLGAVVFGDIRMHVRYIGRSLCKARFDFGFLLLQFVHSCLHGRLVHSIFNGFENPFDASLYLFKGAAARFCFRPPLTALSVGLLGIGAHCDRHGFGRYQLVGEAYQHAPLDVVTANRPTIVAGPFAEVTKTAVPVVDDDAVFSATASASK
jgi:hypothetical protein